MNIESIVNKSKKIILETGEFPPCIFVELDHVDFMGIGLPQSEELDNGYERARLKFLAGRTFAQKLLKTKKNRKRKVTGACVVTEVWYTDSRIEEGRPRIRPSLSPQRKEGLSITAISTDSMKQELIMYQILRDGSGTLVDLLKASMPDADGSDGVIRGAGLPCFLAGVRTAKQDPSQAIHEFRRTYDRYSPLHTFAE